MDIFLLDLFNIRNKKVKQNPSIMSKYDFNKELLQLRKPLSYFALQLTANSDDADDLLQDTMMKAINYRDKFEARTNLKAWLYTIMKNTFINNYRRAVKANTIMDKTDDLYYLNAPKPADEDAPETTLAYKEIKKKVAELEDEYHIPFEMHFTGYKYKEIAEDLDLPIGTVKSRIFLARQKLMTTLKGYV